MSAADNPRTAEDYAEIYRKLIKADRLRTSEEMRRDLAAEVASDNGRIVTSTGFRRLQTKAQVFSLEQNASVRTRLTHTLEVAMYGEMLAGETFSRLMKDVAEDLRLPFVKTVENACLLHDVGNPPFGHVGEFAIREWFRNHRNRKRIHRAWHAKLNDEEIKKYYGAFEGFDGNPHGFRIVTKLQWVNDNFGLNLTLTLLASTMKYLGSTPDNERLFSKKAGFYETDRDTIVGIWKRLDLRTTAENELAQRHPLAFLMEAADDIAYCLSDIEDAIEKRIVTESDFLRALADVVKELIELQPRLGEEKSYYERSGDDRAAPDTFFTRFRIHLTRQLIRAAADAFVVNQDAILEGTFGKPLLEAADGFALRALRQLKSYARKYIFVSREALDVEITAFTVLETILNRLAPLLSLSEEDFRCVLGISDNAPRYGEHALEQHVLSLLPKKHQLAYIYDSKKRPDLEPVFRTHLLVDYVAGMTDSHAVKIHRMLSGQASGGFV